MEHGQRAQKTHGGSQGAGATATMAAPFQQLDPPPVDCGWRLLAASHCGN